MDRVTALQLREPGGGEQEEEEELDMSTPHSYFDPYKPDDGAKDEAAMAAAEDGSPRPDAGPGDDRPVVVHAAPSPPSPPSTEAPLALPASPREAEQPRNRFVISFQDVQSPEKAEGFVPRRPPLAGRKKRALPTPARRVEEEGLGDDWASRPWREPSVEAARTARRRALVSHGRLPLYSTDPDDLLFLGTGITLYFYFVRAIALFCLLASVLHIPHLIIAWSGGMLEPYSIGDSTAGAFMAAGHMLSYPGMETTGGTTRWCELESVNTIFAPNVPCTEPVIQLLGRRSNVYIKADHASYLITACDALSCLLFVATWLLLVRKHRSIQNRKEYATAVVSTKDYAIAVRGLPEDAREEEIVAHFNRLYALNGGDEDWTSPGSCCGWINAKRSQRTSESSMYASVYLHARPRNHLTTRTHDIRNKIATTRSRSKTVVDITGKVIGPDLQPVDQPLPAHEHPVYKRSWVVEAVVVHPMGSLIRRYGIHQSPRASVCPTLTPHHQCSRTPVPFIYVHSFKKLEKLSQQLLYQRAVAKRVNANTTFKGGKGADPRQFEKARQQLRVTQDRIDDEQLRLKVGTQQTPPTHSVPPMILPFTSTVPDHRRSRGT